MPENIGFIGLGVMGKPMAKHLVSAGHHLTVHNRSRGAVDELVAGGATAAASPVEVARAADVVITMLPDTPDVERVIGGDNGVLAGLKKGAVVIDMSSVSPVATERLAKMVADKGGAMLDAPVSGGEIGAINASLSIMVGGDEATFHGHMPSARSHHPCQCLQQSRSPAQQSGRTGSPSGPNPRCVSMHQYAVESYVS